MRSATMRGKLVGFITVSIFLVSCAEVQKQSEEKAQDDLARCKAAVAKQPVVPPVPIATAIEQYSFQMSMDALFASGMFRRAKDFPRPLPTDRKGSRVERATFKRELVNGALTDLVEIELAIWLGPVGDIPGGYMNSHYILRAKMVPYLITPETLPNIAQRKEWICRNQEHCSDDVGILLQFVFIDLLWKEGGRTIVTCGEESKSYPIHEVPSAVSEILTVAAETMATMPPKGIGLNNVINSLKDITGNAQLKLIGANIGTNGGIKIGLLFDGGQSGAFNKESPVLLTDPALDWEASIVPSLIHENINRAAQDRAQKKAAQAPLPVKLDRVSADLILGGIKVHVAGRVLVCGDVPFTFDTTYRLLLCAGSDFGSCENQPFAENVFRPATWQLACWAIEGLHSKLTEWIKKQILSFNVGEIGLSPSEMGLAQNGCASSLQKKWGGPPVGLTFPLQDDILFTTNLYVDRDLFLIGGRSEAQDDEKGIRRDEQGRRRDGLPACPWPQSNYRLPPLPR
jgi:hypothetical protein